MGKQLRAEAAHLVVHEARVLAKKAKDHRSSTQMGNQGHPGTTAAARSSGSRPGAIGDVREVHIWTNRPLAYWPQGIPRPQPQRIAGELRWNMTGGWRGSPTR